MPSLKSEKRVLAEIIREQVFFEASKGSKITLQGSRFGTGNPTYQKWIFDFRAITLTPRWLNCIAELFWEMHADKYPFQVGGAEAAGIPLVAAIVMKGVERGTPVNGFFIRKSRKREGLMKQIEGIVDQHPVILVDDIINSGGTFQKQIIVLEGIGAHVSNLFSIIAFRTESAYRFASEKNIVIKTLFTLKDFGMDFLTSNDPELPKNSFSIKWKFSTGDPSFEHVIQKSAPIIDEENVYFGTDHGKFYAINQTTGKVAWSYNIGKHPKGKGIFSSPALHRNVVYFGAYDGNMYALNTNDGSVVWTYDEADWIGSSPSIAHDLGILFIGLEFGLIGKRGGIAAIDITTGKKCWGDRTPALTHGSPLYIKEENMVVIGSNDGVVYAYGAEHGQRRWHHRTASDVKSSLAYDPKRRLILFGSMDTKCYALSARDGSPVFALQTGAGIYSTPLVVDDIAYVASLDKCIYGIDLSSGKERFSFQTGGRIFSSPIIAEDSLWIGSNDGRLYELDISSGKLKDFFQLSERIVNKIAYNPRSEQFFVPTVANELYCIARRASV